MTSRHVGMPHVPGCRKSNTALGTREFHCLHQLCTCAPEPSRSRCRPASTRPGLARGLRSGFGEAGVEGVAEGGGVWGGDGGWAVQAVAARRRQSRAATGVAPLRRGFTARPEAGRESAATGHRIIGPAMDVTIASGCGHLPERARKVVDNSLGRSEPVDNRQPQEPPPTLRRAPLGWFRRSIPRCPGPDFRRPWAGGKGFPSFRAFSIRRTSAQSPCSAREDALSGT